MPDRRVRLEPTLRLGTASDPALRGRIAQVRLIVVTPGNPVVTEHDASGGVDEFPLPRDALVTYDWLYRDPGGQPPLSFVWVVGLDENGTAIASSPMRSFRLAPG